MPITVYVVAVGGVAVTVAPNDDDKLDEGLHKYDTPPLAASVADAPGHIIPLEGVMLVLIAGILLTVTVAEAIAEHPFASVPVTV